MQRIVYGELKKSKRCLNEITTFLILYNDMIELTLKSIQDIKDNNISSILSNHIKSAINMSLILSDLGSSYSKCNNILKKLKLAISNNTVNAKEIEETVTMFNNQLLHKHKIIENYNTSIAEHDKNRAKYLELLNECNANDKYLDIINL